MDYRNTEGEGIITKKDESQTKATNDVDGHDESAKNAVEKDSKEGKEELKKFEGVQGTSGTNNEGLEAAAVRLVEEAPTGSVSPKTTDAKAAAAETKSSPAPANMSPSEGDRKPAAAREDNEKDSEDVKPGALKEEEKAPQEAEEEPKAQRTMPLRFRSAFILFSSERHKQIRKELGQQGKLERTANVAKMVSRDWRNQTPEEKSVWSEKARKDRARYDLEMMQYTDSIKTASGAPRELPKRPMSAYLSYSNKRRAALKRMYPDATNAELSKMLSKAWKEAPAEVKAEYMDEAARLREQYNIDMMPWRGKIPRQRRSAKAKAKASKKRKQAKANENNLASYPQSFDIEMRNLAAAGTWGMNPPVAAANLMQPPQQQQQQQQQQQLFATEMTNGSLGGGFAALSGSRLNQVMDFGNDSERSLGGGGGGAGAAFSPANQFQLLQGAAASQMNPSSQAMMFGSANPYAAASVAPDMQLLQQLQAAQQQQQQLASMSTPNMHRQFGLSSDDFAFQLQRQQLMNQQLQLASGQVDMGGVQHQHFLGTASFAPAGGGGGTGLQDLASRLRQDHRAAEQPAGAPTPPVTEAELMQQLARGQPFN